ncbi:hypothetical protein BT69DRAFT_1353114, partial [Atractiella rhizophila]
MTSIYSLTQKSDSCTTTISFLINFLSHRSSDTNLPQVSVQNINSFTLCLTKTITNKEEVTGGNLSTGSSHTAHLREDTTPRQASLSKPTALLKA